MATRNGITRIYATDFHNGKVDSFDSTWAAVLPGAFVDPNVPAGYAPFGIQQIQGSLLVTYAVQDSARHDDVPGPGNGLVDVYDFDGVLQARLISHGALNSPWGLALAPNDFGDFSNELLVGNFGDGTINSFLLVNGDFLGAVADSLGNNIVNHGLWGLAFGNGASGGDTDKLYFTAGIPGSGQVEDHGLFGLIRLAAVQPTPVLVSGLSASISDGGVLLRWSMPVDIAPLGFNVYRSEGGADWHLLTDQPVRGIGSNYQYRDVSAAPGARYSYEIGAILPDGTEERHGPIEVSVPALAPLALSAAPSPTAGAATALFSLPAAGNVRIALFDATGREVNVLADQAFGAGKHSVSWAGTDASGHSLPSGTYYLRLNSAFGEKTAPITIIK